MLNHTAPADFTPPKKLVIASRESPLAMWQALHIQSRLQALYPTTTVDILGMTTTGDQILDTPLALVGGKGLGQSCPGNCGGMGGGQTFGSALGIGGVGTNNAGGGGGG